MTENLIVWSTLLAAIAALLTALVNLFMLLEMRKQRRMQTSPRIIVEGELVFRVQVKKGVASLPRLEGQHSTLSNTKFLVLNVGSGDALNVKINFDILSASAELAKRDPSFKFSVVNGFYIVKSISYDAGYSVQHINNFPVGLIREDQELHLDRLGVLESYLMAYAEYVTYKASSGLPFDDELTFSMPFETTYRDLVEASFSNAQCLSLDVTFIATEEDGFDLGLILRAISN